MQETEQLKHALLTLKKPSEYFEALRNDGRLQALYPELYDLIGVEQDPVHHPEGDVYTHTMMVLDNAAALRDEAKDPLALMLAALLHDTGKKEATKRKPNGRLASIGHEQYSEKKAAAFLKRMGLEDEDAAVSHVALHMRPNMYAHDRSKTGATNRLFAASAVPEDLILLSQADKGGRSEEKTLEDNRKFLEDRLRLFRENNKEKDI